jgi:hypothetical protein
MTGKTHDFKAKLAEGEAIERKLDAFFRSQGYWVGLATREQQRVGIDRHFRHKLSGKHFTVDYKADNRAHETGNFFIETVSVDSADKAGWAIRAECERIFYYVVQRGVLYVLETETIRNELPRWMLAFPTGTARNEKYETHGVLVPMFEIELVAYAKLDIPEEVS